jgi:hypothetical protein
MTLVIKRDEIISQSNLRNYLEKEDKGKLTIDSILSKIQIKS